MHVSSTTGEAKFWLEPEIGLARNYNLTNVQLREIQNIIEEHLDEFKNAWKNAPELEVTNISTNGIWLWVRGREMFMSYHDFPWFKQASVAKITNLEEPSPGHLYWPELDIDLSLDIIENPAKYPIKMQ